MQCEKTYESEKEIRQLFVRVCKLDINEFCGHALVRGQNAAALERVDLVDKADGLLGAFADCEELFVVADSHCRDALSALDTLSKARKCQTNAMRMAPNNFDTYLE